MSQHLSRDGRGVYESCPHYAPSPHQTSHVQYVDRCRACCVLSTGACPRARQWHQQVSWVVLCTQTPSPATSKCVYAEGQVVLCADRPMKPTTQLVRLAVVSERSVCNCTLLECAVSLGPEDALSAVGQRTVQRGPEFVLSADLGQRAVSRVLAGRRTPQATPRRPPTLGS